MSIFDMPISTGQTFAARGPEIKSDARRGTICHETPNRSFSQPHCEGIPPSAVSASHSLSVSP